MVTMVSYNPLALAVVPIAFRTFLLCRTSRIMIISVRSALSATEIEKHEMLKATSIAPQFPLSLDEAW